MARAGASKSLDKPAPKARGASRGRSSGAGQGRGEGRPEEGRPRRVSRRSRPPRPRQPGREGRRPKPGPRQRKAAKPAPTAEERSRRQGGQGRSRRRRRPSKPSRPRLRPRRQDVNGQDVSTVARSTIRTPEELEVAQVAEPKGKRAATATKAPAKAAPAAAPGSRRPPRTSRPRRSTSCAASSRRSGRPTSARPTTWPPRPRPWPPSGSRATPSSTRSRARATPSTSSGSATWPCPRRPTRRWRRSTGRCAGWTPAPSGSASGAARRSPWPASRPCRSLRCASSASPARSGVADRRPGSRPRGGASVPGRAAGRRRRHRPPRPADQDLGRQRPVRRARRGHRDAPAVPPHPQPRRGLQPRSPVSPRCWPCWRWSWSSTSSAPPAGRPTSSWPTRWPSCSAGRSGTWSTGMVRSPGVLRGEVVDFIKVPNWPTFNVADSAITIGVILIAVRGWRT